MGNRKPYTLRERRRMADQFGHRPTNNWGSGTLPAPWAEGDVVRRMDSLSDDRLYGMSGEFFVVCYATSIDEGDGWYFRVWDGEAERRSDRLHVVYADRSEWDTSVDWMGAFRLVDSADPEGLALREQLLADGWSYEPPPRCETCGQELPRVDSGGNPHGPVGETQP